MASRGVVRGAGPRQRGRVRPAGGTALAQRRDGCSPAHRTARPGWRSCGGARGLRASGATARFRVRVRAEPGNGSAHPLHPRCTCFRTGERGGGFVEEHAGRRWGDRAGAVGRRRCFLRSRQASRVDASRRLDGRHAHSGPGILFTLGPVDREHAFACGPPGHHRGRSRLHRFFPGRGSGRGGLRAAARATHGPHRDPGFRCGRA